MEKVAVVTTEVNRYETVTKPSSEVIESKINELLEELAEIRMEGKITNIVVLAGDSESVISLTWATPRFRKMALETLTSFLL